MSQENVRLLRSAIDEFNETRRFGPAFEACVHPKVSFQDEIGACETRDEVRDYLEGFADAIGGLRVEVEETRDLGDTVLSVVRQSGRGSASSARRAALHLGIALRGWPLRPLAYLGGP
jgi:hypothetical protein